MNAIYSVSHVIWTRVSTRVLAYKNLCHRYTRKKKTGEGLNPGPLTRLAVVLPMSY